MACVRAPLTFQAISIWRNELLNEEIVLRDVIDLETTFTEIGDSNELDAEIKKLDINESADTSKSIKNEQENQSVLASNETKNDEDEEEEEDGEDGDGTQAGGGNEFKKFRSKLWKSDLPEKVHDTFGYPTAPWSLTDSIMYCGETHMQSVEIVEQVLLVTQHLAQVSFMCRITLLERDIEKILNRIVETMPHNTYIMALVEVTLETLNWTD